MAWWLILVHNKYIYYKLMVKKTDKHFQEDQSGFGISATYEKDVNK